MTTQYIVGTLAPTQPEAITEHTYRHIYKAITDNRLFGIVFAENWQEGILRFNNHTPNVTPNECASPLEFITRLTKLLSYTGLAELGLEGQITVTVPQTNPVVFRLCVENGNVNYEQASLVWNERQPLFSIKNSD